MKIELGPGVVDVVMFLCVTVVILAIIFSDKCPSKNWVDNNPSIMMDKQE